MYGVGGQPEVLMGGKDLHYNYEINNLPKNVYIKEGEIDNYVKTSAIYGY